VISCLLINKIDRKL